MKSSIQFFIENYKLTLILSIFLLIYGLMGLRSMNSEVFPAVSLATATITTRYAGASAEDVEVKITKPIEDKIKGIVGIKDISSISKSGMSVISVRVDMDRYNVTNVMDKIQKDLDAVTDLPSDLDEQPAFLELNSEEMPVFQIALLGPNDNRQRDYIAEELQDILEDTNGVKAVHLSGHAKREFHALLDLKLLRSKHIGISETIAKIQSRNINIPGGNLKNQEDEALIRIEGKIESAEDFGNFLIRSNFTGQQVHLKDVAQVLDTQEEKEILTRYNGHPATLITVIKKAGEDTITLIQEVKKKLEEAKSSFGDPAIEMVVYDDSSKVVQNKLDVLASNAVVGLGLVIFFLFLFLPGRIGVVAGLSLPLSIMATFGLMSAFGMNLDSITVLALIISIGMLVDNSVVISESYSRYLSEGMVSKTAAIRAVSELAGPITASALTTIAAFLPMMVTKGVMGKFILMIPIIVTSSLFFSLLESFYLLPMRLNRMAPNMASPERKGSSKSLFFRFENLFEWLLRKCVNHRYWVLLIFTGIIVVSILFLGVFNKFILFPPDETEIYLARYETANGTPVERTDVLGGDLAQRVQAKLGDKFKHIIATSGQQKQGADDTKGGDGAHLGLLQIYVTDETKYNVPYTEILRDLRTVSKEGFKSLTFEEVINGPPVGNPIEGKFRSNDLDALNRMVSAVKVDLKDIPGIKNLRKDDVIGEDEIYIKINYVQADRVGLSVDEIGETIRSAISGRIVSQVTLNNKDIDIRVRLKKNYRKNLDDLKLIKIQNSRGDLIPLSSLARFDRLAGTPQIKRYNNKRSVTLVGEVNDIKITSQEANQLMLQSFEKHRSNIKGVTLYQGGAAESTAESLESLVQSGCLAAIGILALLVFMFNSYLKPFIIMSTIPLGLFGFSIAFYLHQKPVSFLALIGVIGLAGIIVNSGIVLISYIEQLRKESQNDLDTILIQASKVRLRAVLVTSLTTISGLFPTAYGIGGRDSMLIPMTLAMAWGLTTGTLLTLLWIPSFYRIIEDGLNLIEKMKHRKSIKVKSL